MVCRRAVKAFSKAMRSVSMRVMEVLVGKLMEEGGRGGGVPWEERVGGKDQASNSVVRFNYYPPCPQPSLTLGLGAHSDPHLLTILHQDLVGGLQICKDGLWMAVKPKPNALVVNIGDALQVDPLFLSLLALLEKACSIGILNIQFENMTSFTVLSLLCSFCRYGVMMCTRVWSIEQYVTV